MLVRYSVLHQKIRMYQLSILSTRNGAKNMSNVLRKIFANIKADNNNNQPGKKRKGKKGKGNGGTDTGEEQENEKDQNNSEG